MERIVRKDSDWWTSFFEKRVAALILDSPRAGELDFLIRSLKLSPGSKLFDQCCGWGRVSGPLLERGVEVWGVDSSPELVTEARSRWGQRFVLGDAAEYRQEPRCQAAVNLYSSFGYRTDDGYNRKVLLRLVESVVVGGRILLDTINPERVYRNFKEVFTYTTPSGTQISRRSRLEENGRLLRQDWSFLEPNGERFEKNGSVTRLYSVGELEMMIKEISGRPLFAYGDFQGQPYRSESERLIWLAER